MTTMEKENEAAVILVANIEEEIAEEVADAKEGNINIPSGELSYTTRINNNNNSSNNHHHNSSNVNHHREKKTKKKKDFFLQFVHWIDSIRGIHVDSYDDDDDDDDARNATAATTKTFSDRAWKKEQRQRKHYKGSDGIVTQHDPTMTMMIELSEF